MPKAKPAPTQESLDKLEEFHIINPETGEVTFSPSLLELEEHAVLMLNYLNPDGSENPDPTPIAPPIGYRKAPSLVENMRAMIREHALAIAIAGQGAESFEEADDFDVGDDYEPSSPWEGEFEPIAQINAEEAAKNAAAKARSTPPQPSSEAKPRAEGTPSGGSGGETPPEKKDK